MFAFRNKDSALMIAIDGLAASHAIGGRIATKCLVVGASAWKCSAAMGVCKL